MPDSSDEKPLSGGNAGGAVRVGNTIRKPGGPWMPSVHAVLRHLEGHQFPGAPRAIGIDEDGRQILTELAGQTVGERRPWPKWAHDEDTLDDVADWLRSFHEAMADYQPPAEAIWRMGGRWMPGMIIGHNDAAPYNAVWQGRLVGFIDWDFAGPVTREWDLAWSAFSWTPLHSHAVVAEEGFNDFEGRPRRLRRLLSRYGWAGMAPQFISTVQDMALANAQGIRRLAGDDDPLFVKMLQAGVAENLEVAAAELDGLVF